MVCHSPYFTSAKLEVIPPCNKIDNSCNDQLIKIAIVATLQEEDFSWNLYFAISPMANLLRLNSAYYFICS